MLIEIWVDRGSAAAVRAAMAEKPFNQWRLHRPLARRNEVGKIVQKIVDSDKWLLINISRARDEGAIHEDAIFEKPHRD